MKVNILGTEYTITVQPMDEAHSNSDGYIDTSTKEIFIDDMKPGPGKKTDLEAYKKSVVRHELIHAFLYESGLDAGSWGIEEEIVDWIALQFSKIVKVCNEVNGL